MELAECEEFVQRATREFERLAKDHGYAFERLKKYFWIRYPGRTEVFQGNYETTWLRGFMHHLTSEDVRRLRQAVRYTGHCREFPTDGWQFRIASDDDISVVKEIVLARCTP